MSSYSTVIYDSAQSLFYEATINNTDISGLAFIPLGYSFFKENMEGQPPEPGTFIFSTTPSSIQISWTNPTQYASGVSNNHDQFNSDISGELASTVNANHNIYFPLVNRIMIQIYNKEKNSYETWGTKRSPITSSTETSGGVTDLSSGYVICAKNYPIPPMNTSISPYFGTRNGFGRTTKVYELNDFANSIILYKQNSTPNNDTIQPTLDNTKLVSALKDEDGKELYPSSDGYEIKLWLENQYDSGSMTESDFNVVTLINDNNGDPINFLKVKSPSAPTLLTASIAFNDLGSVSSGNTVVQLIVKDPLKTSTDDEDYNATINLVGIKFQYANTIGDPITGDWKDISGIYYSTSLIPTNAELPSLIGVTDGTHFINRLNDNSTISSVTETTHYYYIKLNNDFLGVTDNDMNNTFKFRASYKNASSDDFGPALQSASILINEPVQPTISSVKMTEFNKFTITLGQFTDVEDIIGDTISDSVGISNTNMGVYLKDISFNVAYKYGDEASQTPITTFTEIQGASSTTTDSVLINTTSFASSTYTYEIPTGLFPSDSTNTNAITYYFSASVKNNLINKFSTESTQRSIEITKPTDTQFTLTLTPQEAVANYNNKIQATWSSPPDGTRGIVTLQASAGLPKLSRFDLSSNTLRKVDNDNDVTYLNTTNTSARDVDPTRILMFTFYDTLKKGAADSVTKDLDLTIREYNEYINNYTEVSTTISATATKPAVVTIDSHTALSISNADTTNAVTLNWTQPSNRGLDINGSNIRNTISTYTIDISRNSTTNKYLDSNDSWQDVTFQTTTIQTDNTNDRTGTTDAAKTKTLTSTDHNSLLWPDSIYNYTIRATNSLGYQSDAQTTVETFSTGEPTFLPSIFTYFTNTRLNSLRNTYDLKNNNNYSNLGVLVSGGISSTTTYGTGTAVQITNTKDLVDITSDTITHVLNKKHLQNFSIPLSSAAVKTWSSAVPTTAKQACFKIVNEADSGAVLYTRGLSTNHTTESGDSILFDVLRTNRKDVYSDTYDNRNRGYWLIEDIHYKINLTTQANLTDYLYTPLKFELESYYNTNGSDPNFSTTLNGKTIILQNSYSSNSGYVYLDILDSNPSIGKNASNDMITYTPSRQINGIPNLARGGTIGLKYKLSNYSQYYLLKSAVNVSEHYFSYAPDSANSVINWVSKVGGTRNNNNWIIDKKLSSIPSIPTATKEITIKIRARNTKGSTDFPIDISTNSTVFNFIYDKPSSDEFDIIESSLQEVPSSFNPTYGTTSAQSIYSTTAYSAKNDISNNKQLSLWNNYFYGSEGWRTDTGITTENCADYGMANTLPVFNTGTDYKWVIFKYQGQGNTSSAYTYYTVIAKFSDSDFDYDNNVVDEDIVVYFYNRGQVTQGNDSNNYYWLNISGKSGYGKSDASTGGINTYAGTVGISTQNANSSNFESASYTKLGITGSRILGGWLNSSAIPENTTADFYLAVGIKNTTATNNSHVKIRKPEITLSQESNVPQLLS